MKIVAIANQKGGVAKTTTAINLGAALVERGQSVLVVDLDPQGNASTGLGIPPDRREPSSYDLLLGEALASDIRQPTAVAGLFVVPATTALSSTDVELQNAARRAYHLRNRLAADTALPDAFDWILIDCPPSLNLLTVNALVAAHSVLVPLQSEFFALEGLSQLMLTIRDIRQAANPRLRVEGVLLTMHDQRNNLAQQVERDARETLGDLVYRTVIPRNVRLSEAPSHGLPALVYDPDSRGAAAYRALAAEVLAAHLPAAAATGSDA